MWVDTHQQLVSMFKIKQQEISFNQQDERLRFGKKHTPNFTIHKCLEIINQSGMADMVMEMFYLEATFKFLTETS
jgi:hypothetical protein